MDNQNHTLEDYLNFKNVLLVIATLVLIIFIILSYATNRVKETTVILVVIFWLTAVVFYLIETTKQSKTNPGTASPKTKSKQKKTITSDSAPEEPSPGK